MEMATARMIEKKAFMVLKYSLLPARVRLLIVATMCVCNPDCSPA
jgi:hypothetical protein